MQEIWKDVPGYEGFFNISNLGRIETVSRKVKNNNYKGVRISKKRILQPFLMKNNYYAIKLCVNGVNKKFYLHRLIAQAFIPNPKNKREINHIDGNKQNNNILNLEWVDRKENITHALMTGLLKTGEQCPWHKLTEKQVKKIRSEYIPFINGYKNLGKKYGVSWQTIVSIIKNKSWKHIEI
jgi:hypothetical protein